MVVLYQFFLFKNRLNILDGFFTKLSSRQKFGQKSPRLCWLELVPYDFIKINNLKPLPLSIYQ